MEEINITKIIYQNISQSASLSLHMHISIWKNTMSEMYLNYSYIRYNVFAKYFQNKRFLNNALKRKILLHFHTVIDFDIAFHFFNFL